MQKKNRMQSQHKVFIVVYPTSLLHYLDSLLRILKHFIKVFQEINYNPHTTFIGSSGTSVFTS